MKIAILGATGMLGHHTALALQAMGEELVVLHRAGSKLDRLSDLRFEARTADADYPSADLARVLAGVDVLVHAAAYYPPEPRAAKDDEAIATAQMQRILDACRQANCRLVYVGGAIALARRQDGQAADETQSYSERPKHRSGYLLAKWRMDQMALAAAAAGQWVAVAIPAMTFGAFDFGPTTGRLIVGIASGKFPRYLPGKRNVIDARDAGRGIALVATSGQSGQRYLLTGTNIDMRDLTGKIAKHAGMPAPKPAPLAVATLIARFNHWRYRRFGGQKPDLDETALAIITAGQYLDGSKAKQALGFVAEHDPDAAIAYALTWFRSVGMLAARTS